jgi:hypothetical protein
MHKAVPGQTGVLAVESRRRLSKLAEHSRLLQIHSNISTSILLESL